MEELENNFLQFKKEAAAVDVNPKTNYAIHPVILKAQELAIAISEELDNSVDKSADLDKIIIDCNRVLDESLPFDYAATVKPSSCC